MFIIDEDEYNKLHNNMVKNNKWSKDLLNELKYMLPYVYDEADGKSLKNIMRNKSAKYVRNLSNKALGLREEDETLEVCPSCNETTARIQLVQLHALDEPKTEFYNCTNPECLVPTARVPN